jgi:xylulokinase
MWFLGMDVGTGGTRAVVVNAAGKLMGAASSEHAPFRAEHPGWAAFCVPSAAWAAFSGSK